MMNSEPTNKKSQISVAFSVLKWVLETLFPSLLILRVQSYVSKSAFSQDEWIYKQKARCTKVALLLLIPSLLSLYGTKLLIEEVQFSNHLMERSIALGKKKQVKKAFVEGWREATQAIGDLPFKRIGFMLLLPAMISFYIRSQNDILVKTKKLQKVLRNNGFGRDGKIGLAVYLPIGIVVDVTGHNPKDLVYNNAIWYALNIQIDERDWIERPDKRSIVLFKKAFTLAPEYIYK